jgi:hypothetical protein
MQEYRDVMNEPEMQFIDQELTRIEEWIESEHTRPLGSQEDIHLYTLKIQEINATPLFENLEVRKRNITRLFDKYNSVKRQTETAITAVRVRMLVLRTRPMRESCTSCCSGWWNRLRT